MLSILWMLTLRRDLPFVSQTVNDARPFCIIDSSLRRFPFFAISKTSELSGIVALKERVGVKKLLKSVLRGMSKIICGAAFAWL